MDEEGLRCGWLEVVSGIRAVNSGQRRGDIAGEAGAIEGPALGGTGKLSLGLHILLALVYVSESQPLYEEGVEGTKVHRQHLVQGYRAAGEVVLELMVGHSVQVNHQRQGVTGVAQVSAAGSWNDSPSP